MHETSLIETIKGVEHDKSHLKSLLSTKTLVSDKLASDLEVCLQKHVNMRI